MSESKTEKFSSIEGVVGKEHSDISEDERKKVLKTMEVIFRDQEEFKKYLLREFKDFEEIPNDSFKTIFYEKEKTPGELEIIDIVNKKTNELRKKFGFTDLSIPPKNIYIIPYNAPWPKEAEGSSSYYSPIGQFIVIREAESDIARSSKTVLAWKILHEMIHFKSYNSLKQLEDSSFDGHIVGLGSSDGDNDESFLSGLNEAVTEELTTRIMDKLKDHPRFKKEMELTNELKKRLSDIKTADGEPLLSGEEFFIGLNKDNKKIYLEYKELAEEREALNELIEKIFKKNPDKFKDREEVFNLFVKAVVTGDTVSLSQLIDNTFGKDTFKKLSKVRGGIEKEKEYIKDLN